MGVLNDAVTGGSPDAAEAALSDSQREYIQGLRDYAAFLEANPSLCKHLTGGFYECAYFNTRDGLTEAARLAGGRWSKDATGDAFFRLTRQFGPVKFVIYTSRSNVCERVVTTETVTRKVPDPELVAEIPMVTVTETVEHVDWICPPSMLSLDYADDDRR